MPRIFKGSESTLRLLIHTCNQEGKISDLKIALYTNDPSVAVEFTDRYTIEGNIVSLTVPNYAFGTMEDGVINYIAQGMIDDDTFLTQRQSNYFLKTPANYNPTPMPEEVVLGELAPMITENGVFEYTPTDVDAWNKATIEVNVPQEGGSCNLEDKGVNPSINDRDGNGVIVITPSENYDGLLRVVLDPTTIYNEGVSAGKAEGGDLNIGTGDIYLTANERGQRFEILPSEFEYDAFDKFIVEMENFDLGGDTNIYDALSVNQLLMDGVISYNNNYIFKGEITEIQRTRPDVGDARYTLDGSLNVYNGQTMGYDIQVGDNVIVIGTLSEYNGAPQLSAGSEIKAWWREGGSGNCDDAYNEGFDNGYTTGVQDGYGQGYNDGQANCGGGDGGSCNLTQLVVTENGWYEPRPEEFGYLEMRESAAFDTGVQLFDDSWLEILFNVGETDAEIPTLFGVENSDWDDSTFAARWYSGVLSVKIGNATVDIPLSSETAVDKLHKLKVGKNYGVWFDDGEYGSIYSDDWVIPTDTIYIGAMHDNTNSENGIWRPWNGFISNVTIHGVRNGEGAEWHFEPGDFGKWGEYKCVETDEVLPNLLGDGGATHMCCKQYGEPLFNGYSAVEVNVPTIDRAIGEYRYNPVTVGDIAGGLRADEINIGWTGMIGEDGDWVYENQRILLKGSLKNNNHRVYTTKKVTSIENDFVFTEGRENIQNITFDDNIYYITLMDIELVQLKEMVIGEFTSRLTFRYCNFPKLNKIVVKTPYAYGIGFEDTTVAENGVLYLREGYEHADNIIPQLPSGWTIEYI